MNTPDSIKGVTEKQLNEIYNLMDVYCHPFTSGAQEIPIQEAKLTEIPTLVTDYSCGTAYSQPNTGSLPLSWQSYRLPTNNQFIKASTSSESITRQLKKVYAMSPEKRRQMGKRGRDFVLENFSIEVLGPRWEKILDSMKLIPKENWNIPFFPSFPNPNYQPKDIKDDTEWIIDIHKGFLNTTVVADHTDVLHWMKYLKHENRKKITEHFKKLAEHHGERQKQDFIETRPKVGPNIDQYLGPEDANERICVVLPQSIGDIIMATSLLEDLKNKYKKKLYFATLPEYFYLLEGNPYIDKIIPYCNEMGDLTWMEGAGFLKPQFYMTFLLHVGTQIMNDYTHHGRD